MVLQEKTFHFAEKEYVLREMSGEEDLAFMSQFTHPVSGKINMRDLWIKRLTRCVIKPSMSETDILQLSSKELATLRIWWNQMNEPDETDFLSK